MRAEQTAAPLLPQPVAGAPERQHMAVVQQPIEDRRGDHLIAKHLAPLSRVNPLGRLASIKLAGEENVIAHGCRRRQPGGNGGGSDTKTEPADSQSLCQHWVAPISTRRQPGWPVGCRDLC